VQCSKWSVFDWSTRDAMQAPTIQAGLLEAVYGRWKEGVTMEESHV